MNERKGHWEKIYSSHSSRDVSWYQTKPALSLELIKNSKINPSDAIIDIGGGASNLVDNLLTEGYDSITVLDISHEALQCSQERLGTSASRVHWIVQDITQFTPKIQYAIWHDRAVFHFLTAAEDRKKYVKSLINGLVPGSSLILAAFAIGGPTKCSGLDIVQYDAYKLQQELGSKFDLLSVRDEKHLTPSNSEQLFTYYHLKLR